MTARPAGRSRLLLAVVLLGAVAAAIRWLPLQQGVDWARGLGPLGPVALGGLYVLACVLFVPGTILTLAAGGLFGVLVGSITVSIASTLGATAAMLVGRTLARRWVAGLVADHPRFAAVDAAVAHQGFKVVLLTRLSPVFPFNLLNFAYGLTRVSVRDFALASWIGMAPATVMYVWIGAALGEVAGATERERSTAEWVLYGVGLLATVIATVFVTRLARRALAQVAPTAPGAGAGA